MLIRTRRVYEPPSPADGVRVLVDRLWPRGLAKSSARLDCWAKPCAVSHELRRWYQHDPEKWEEFRRRYYAELDANPAGVAELLEHVGSGPVTLLYGSKEAERNNATALREYLQERVG